VVQRGHQGRYVLESMRSFLCVSVAPRAAYRLRRPIDEALSCLTDDATAVDRVDVDRTGWIAFAGADGDDCLGAPGEAFTVRLSRLLRTRDRDVCTEELATMVANGSDLATLLPPFAAGNRERAGGPVTVANDWLGYRQLYWWQGDGAAAISTSARALSVLAGAGFDEATLGVQAMLGWQVGDLTMFQGVKSLPPATLAKLADGDLQWRRYAEPLGHHASVPTLDDAVEEMAAILINLQASYLNDHPDTVLQLTGGWDSRVLLTAISENQRTGLRALTLGVGTDPDVLIARQLAQLCGIRHEVYGLEAYTAPTPSQAHKLSLNAARVLEYQANPMALAPLLLAESNLEQGHRLAGYGGEVARGKYYPGQPAGAKTSDRLVERLALWRLFSRDGVEAAALDAPFFTEARDGTLATLVNLFPSGDWLRATDSFYLYQEMQRWGGALGTVAAVRRKEVNPMWDRRFIELALAVAPADKRHSLLFGKLMSRLDAGLARIPLESGLIPARLGVRDMSSQVAVAMVTARKAARRVRQRLTDRRKPQLGASGMSELVLAHWRAEPAACDILFDLPMLDRTWLDSLLAGRHGAAPTTVGFLVKLLAATLPPNG
jgi:asparagine synthase (glutamine-hydrolysing)